MIDGQARVLRLEVRVLNRAHVATAYGEAAAEAVQRAVAVLIARFLRDARAARAWGGVGFRIFDGAPDEIDGIIDGGLFLVDLVDVTSSSSLSSLIEELSRALALEVFVVGDHRIHIAPSVHLCGERSAQSGQGDDKPVFNAVASDAPFAGEPVVNDKGWVDRYRSDMCVAARLLGELKAGELSLAFQPIRMAGRPDSLLYEECLLRGPDEAGVSRRLGLDIIALERLGLIRALDCHVAWCAIERLRLDPARRLGVNISAQSACLDAWWSALEAELAADRKLAERLTIEITETSGFPSVSAATAFAERMRALGCRIALDDFGVGRDAIRNLYALRPNIVKLDAFFVRQARHSASGQAALKALISFSRAVGGAVVVEGVETKGDSVATVQAGGAWQQGYFIDPPRRVERESDGESAASEGRPAFGRRPSPPTLAYLGDEPHAALAGAGHAFPLRHHFEFRWGRLAIPLAALFWALIACAMWLGWSGSP